MAGFQKLLLAIDLSPTSTALIRRVIHMYPEDLEKIHVLHVIKPMLLVEPGEDTPNLYDPDIQREMNYARHKIFELLHATGLGSAVDKLYLAYGEPSFQIKRLSREIGADLVIVGSHCKEGDWMQLPGVTTNCVIQGISSDVMAVKI